MVADATRRVKWADKSSDESPPELPFVAGLFILSLVHLQHPLPEPALILALCAAVAGFTHMSILLRGPTHRFPRGISTALLLSTATTLTLSHTIANRLHGNPQTSPSLPARIHARTKPRTNSTPRPTNISSSIRNAHGNATLVVTTITAESCDGACGRYRASCASNAFHTVNSCHALRSRLPCADCRVLNESHVLAQAMPAAVRRARASHMDLASRDSTLNTCYRLRKVDQHTAKCHVSARKVRRLCPCIV